MTLRVTFELGDDDLEHFRKIMVEAREAAEAHTQEEIVSATKELLKEVSSSDVPAFVLDRLRRLEMMTGMVEDREWKLPDDELTRVINALAYFTEPEDLIPDHIPGLGFLDDAIMVELVTRELRHEIDAYRDFCAFRDREGKRREAIGEESSGDVTREEWLSARRTELQSRMRRRRRRDRSRGGRGRSPFSLV